MPRRAKAEAAEPQPGDTVTMTDWPEKEVLVFGKPVVPKVDGLVQKVADTPSGRAVFLFADHHGTTWSHLRVLPLSHLVQTSRKALDATRALQRASEGLLEGKARRATRRKAGS